MKVLQIGKYYYPAIGGIETHLRWLSEELNQVVRLHVLVSSTNFRGSEEVVNGVHVTRLPRFGRFASAPLNIGYARHLLNSYDIIHLHAPNPLAAQAYVRCAPSALLFVSWHSDIVKARWLYAPFKRIEQMLLEQASTIIVASQRHIDVSSVLPTYRHKCTVIPYGIDLSEFGVPANSSGTASRGVPVVLFVGRLVHYKGLQFLITAMTDVPAILRVVGDGPLLEHSRALARERGVMEKVEFLGAISRAELIREYHSCDVLCLPSVEPTEAFGIVLLEAMACGKPVVSTELGTATSLVNLHAETGLVVPPRDPGSLAVALSELLRNKDMAAEMGKNARKRVTQFFSKEVMALRTHATYCSLLRGSQTCSLGIVS